jgi:acetyl-CoA acetyltransferase
LVNELRDRTAVVGIGYARDPHASDAPVFTKASGVSPLTLALRAARAAAEDAGVDPRQIDGGLTRHHGDSVSPTDVLRSLGAREISLSLEVRGPGNNYCVHDLQLAGQAVHAGICDYVLVYRAANARSGFRPGHWDVPSSQRVGGPAQFTTIYGFGSPPQLFAMSARRYVDGYGVTSRDLGAVAVNARTNAQANPRAYMFGRPMTIDDHQASRMVAEPYRLLDCCLETDGAAALLVTTAERARTLRKQPVLISGVAGSRNAVEDVVDTPVKHFAPRLLEAAGIARDDIDLAQLYDVFSDQVMRQLEDLGFCGRGEAKDFIASEGIGLDGRLPLQTAGGLMSEGACYSVQNLVEAVQQLRGEAEDLCPGWRDGDHTYDRSFCRQVRKHDVALHMMGRADGAAILRRGD